MTENRNRLRDTARYVPSNGPLATAYTQVLEDQLHVKPAMRRKP